MHTLLLGDSPEYLGYHIGHSHLHGIFVARHQQRGLDPTGTYVGEANISPLGMGQLLERYQIALVKGL